MALPEPDEGEATVTIDGLDTVEKRGFNISMAMLRLQAFEALQGDSRIQLGPSQQHTFDHDSDLEHRVGVSTESDEKLQTVETGSESDAAVFEVTIDNVSYSDPTITVDYTIENTASVDGTQTVRFIVDGVQIGSVEETLTAGSTTSGSFSYDTSTSDGDADPLESAAVFHDAQYNPIFTLPDSHQTFEFERLACVPEYDAESEVPEVRTGDDRYSTPYNPRAIVRFTANSSFTPGLYSYSVDQSAWVRIDKP